MNRVLSLIALFFTASFSAIVYDLEDIRNESSLLQMPGKPVLESRELTFLLPPNVCPESVEITVTGDTLVEQVTTVSAGEPFIVNGEEYWAGVDSLVNGRDHAVYTKDAFYPESNIASHTIGKMRSYNILKLTICPSSYNPLTKKMRKLSNVSVHVMYDTLTLTRDVSPMPVSFVKALAATAVNYDQFAEAYGQPSRAASTYLVITSKALKNALHSLDEFTRVKKAKGYAVEVITEETWGGGDGATAAIKIREWLQENFESRNIEYVLFIGNPSEGAVPMKYCYPDRGDRHSCYIDFFYGDLSGDWDKNKNGKFGEWGFGDSNDNGTGGLDQYAEVYVGRIPYYGNISETEALLRKMIKYETEKRADIGWRNNVYLPLNAFEAFDGSQLGRAMMSKVFTPAGSNVTPLYDRSCNIDAVIQKWNAGDYGIVTWQGHGLDDYTEGVMYSHRTPELDDSYPAHVYQISCHNGKPANPKNLGYAIFKNAAISTVSAAIQVLYSASMKELGTSATTRHWAYMYDKGLVLDSLSSGESMAQAKATLKLTFDSDWLNASEMNLYGCPEIGLYSCDVIPTPIHGEGFIQKQGIGLTTLDKTLLFDKSVSGQLSVFTVSGRVVYTKGIDSVQCVNLSSLSNGIYFVELKDNKELLFRQCVRIN